MNPGVKSLEAELERAMFRAGGIARSNYGILQKVLCSLPTDLIRPPELTVGLRFPGAELHAPTRASRRSPR